MKDVPKDKMGLGKRHICRGEVGDMFTGTELRNDYIP